MFAGHQTIGDVIVFIAAWLGYEDDSEPVFTCAQPTVWKTTLLASRAGLDGFWCLAFCSLDVSTLLRFDMLHGVTARQWEGLTMSSGHEAYDNKRRE